MCKSLVKCIAIYSIKNAQIINLVQSYEWRGYIVTINIKYMPTHIYNETLQF